MKQHFFFDLDGTLTDPALGITNSILYALKALGQPLPHRDQLYPYIGPPLSNSFQELLHCTAEEADQAIQIYRQYFSKTGLFENTVYPGIPSVLEALREVGTHLHLSTSKPECFAKKILEHFHLAPFFDTVTGSTLDGSLVEKEDVLRLALKRAGSPKAESCLMIGDRKYDVLGARQCGISCVGVLYGYGNTEELLAAGAWSLAHTTDELRTILLNSTVSS